MLSLEVVRHDAIPCLNNRDLEVLGAISHPFNTIILGIKGEGYHLERRGSQTFCISILIISFPWSLMVIRDVRIAIDP